MLKRLGWRMGEGLGKEGNGRVLLVEATFKNDKHGLGHMPTVEQPPRAAAVQSSGDAGGLVTLHSPQVRTELNGIWGHILSFDEGSGQHNVRPPSGEQIAVRSSSLAEPPRRRFDDGSLVALHSLNARSELNGLDGEVLGFDEDSRRHIVMLASGEQVAVRPANLADVSEQPKHSLGASRGNASARACDDYDLRVDFEVELQRWNGGAGHKAELTPAYYTFPPLPPHEKILGSRPGSQLLTKSMKPTSSACGAVKEQAKARRATQVKAIKAELIRRALWENHGSGAVW